MFRHWPLAATLTALLFSVACFGRSDVDGLGLGDQAEGDACRQNANCEDGLYCAEQICTFLEPADEPDRGPPERPQTSPEDCPGFAGFIEVGETVSGSTFARPNRYAASCGGGQAPDEVWVLELAADRSLIISTEGANYDTVIYIREGCDDGPELLCEDDLGADTALIDVPAGTWFVYIDGFNEAGDYDLFVGSAE